ncbi:MAG: hypothetical protein IKK41_05105 [Oscillospiraceae bacterium]|nr:hypothetical protein [Oscillospiraceae bacterium]
MQTNHEDHVIYLKDLLFSALYRWKKILLFGIVLALLLGGVKGISAYRTIKSHTGDLIGQVSESPEQAVLEKKLETLQASYDALAKFQQESVLMQINPYGFYKASLSIFVAPEVPATQDADDQSLSPTGAILNSYASMLTDNAVVQAISDALNVKAETLSELITVSVDPKIGVLDAFVPCTTQEGAQAILDILLDQLDLAQAEVSQTICEHKMSIYQQSVKFTSDAFLAETQAAKVQRMTDLHISITDTKAELNAVASDSPDVVSVRSLIRSAVIYGILGLILGMFVTVVCIWVSHICSSKVYSARTLTNRTQVKVLGGINMLPKMCAAMRKLRLLDNRSVTKADLQAHLIAANVRNLCMDAKHLLVTGTAECAVLSEALQQAMPGVQISLCGSLLTDVAAVNALSDCDYVLLVEECEVSRYGDIQQTVSMIADNNKTLLGCVLLNG